MRLAKVGRNFFYKNPSPQILLKNKRIYQKILFFFKTFEPKTLNSAIGGKFYMSEQQPTISETKPKAENESNEQVVLGEDGKPLSKSQMKKLEKEKKKAETKAKNEEKQKAQESNADDPLKHNYGDLEFCQSSERTERKWIAVGENKSFVKGVEN